MRSVVAQALGARDSDEDALGAGLLSAPLRRRRSVNREIPQTVFRSQALAEKKMSCADFSLVVATPVGTGGQRAPTQRSIKTRSVVAQVIGKKLSGLIAEAERNGWRNER